VLQRLAGAGLTLKLKKCAFATRQMEYIGHELSSDGVRPVQRLITAVTEFKRPADPVEVKRFVHLAGYYRKFIEAFGSIMAQMSRLLKKSIDWEWTEAQEFAFERIMAAMTTKPLLIYPDFRLPFRLETDASKVGLGACLMQDQGQRCQPMAFASKVNNNAEANYSITELECVAVVWAVKLFRPYLYGRTFEIITDHAALKWLMTRPNLAGRLHRWSLTLQEYEFDIVYRPGATNVAADALSRAPAAVLAITGKKRRRRRPPESREAEMEAKTEEADPLMTEESTESRRNAAKAGGAEEAPSTRLAPTLGPAEEASPTRETPPPPPVSQMTEGGDRQVSEARIEGSRPRTRLAKRREEAAAAALAAEVGGGADTREPELVVRAAPDTTPKVDVG
jgi:hypothetical protein